jgi:mono/diheme cytochrome c family protein
MLRIRYLLPVWFFTLWLIACGRTATLAPLPATPTLDPQASLGKELFTRECASCHSLLEDTVIVGPSMKGIAQRAESRVPDQDAHAYLLSSIIDPGGYVLEGYQDLMPANFGKRLTGEEIDALVAYMLTLE